MSFVHLPTFSSPAVRAERLARLVYELLDANDDTERLAWERLDASGDTEPVIGGSRAEHEWRVHLNYLRDLHRVGREILAETIEA